MTMNYSEILEAAYLEGEFGGGDNRFPRLNVWCSNPKIHPIQSCCLGQCRVPGLNSGHRNMFFLQFDVFMGTMYRYPSTNREQSWRYSEAQQCCEGGQGSLKNLTRFLSSCFSSNTGRALLAAQLCVEFLLHHHRYNPGVITKTPSG